MREEVTTFLWKTFQWINIVLLCGGVSQSTVKILLSIKPTCCINMEQDLSSALRRGIKIKWSFYILLKSLTTADI